MGKWEENEVELARLAWEVQSAWDETLRPEFTGAVIIRVDVAVGLIFKRRVEVRRVVEWGGLRHSGE